LPLKKSLSIAKIIKHVINRKKIPKIRDIIFFCKKRLNKSKPIKPTAIAFTINVLSLSKNNAKQIIKKMDGKTSCKKRFLFEKYILELF
jgi:hypothetical protein